MSSNNLPQITLIHIPPEKKDQREEAIRLRNRFKQICSLAPQLNIQIEAIEYTELLIKQPDDISMAKRLKNAMAIWWFGCMIDKAQMFGLWNNLQKHLKYIGLQIPVYDKPDDIEESFNLNCYYPKLIEEIPQAQTSFLSITAQELDKDDEAFAALLHNKLASFKMTEAGIFFRTFYGTQKFSPRLNMAFSREELIEGCTEMVQTLSKNQDIGGIALREVLPISIAWDDLLGEKWRREYRVFIVYGEPILWLWNGHLMHLKRRIERGHLNVIALPQTLTSQVYQYSQKIGQILQAKLLVADFAILEDDSLVLLEINPGYCAGWSHKIVFAVYGQLLGKMNGQSFFSTDIFEKVGIELWGKNCVWDFFTL